MSAWVTIPSYVAKPFHTFGRLCHVLPHTLHDPRMPGLPGLHFKHLFVWVLYHNTFDQPEIEKLFNQGETDCVEQAFMPTDRPPNETWANVDDWQMQLLTSQLQIPKITQRAAELNTLKHKKALINYFCYFHIFTARKKTKTKTTFASNQQDQVVSFGFPKSKEESTECQRSVTR